MHTKLTHNIFTMYIGPARTKLVGSVMNTYLLGNTPKLEKELPGIASRACFVGVGDVRNVLSVLTSNTRLDKVSIVDLSTSTMARNVLFLALVLSQHFIEAYCLWGDAFW